MIEETTVLVGKENLFDGMWKEPKSFHGKIVRDKGPSSLSSRQCRDLASDKEHQTVDEKLDLQKELEEAGRYWTLEHEVPCGLTD